MWLSGLIYFGNLCVSDTLRIVYSIMSLSLMSHYLSRHMERRYAHCPIGISLWMNLLSDLAVFMPTGPKGEKRPADVIGNAVHVMRVLTGEIEDNPSASPKRAKGGKARAKALTPAERTEIARAAASARWKKRS